MFALLSSVSTAGDTVSDLAKHGFGHAQIFEGEALHNEIDAKGSDSGGVGKIVKAVQDHLSEEPNFLAQYEEEARRGNAVIAVHAGDRDRAEEVAEVLQRHGARNLRFFGTLAVSDLTPASNPSARSAESPEPQSNV